MSVRLDDECSDTFEYQCDTCGGELQVLGQLGDLLHLRCRHCGVEASFANEPDKGFNVVDADHGHLEGEYYDD